MKRAAVFVALLLLFSAALLPHAPLVERALAAALAGGGLDVSLAEAGFASPLSYRIAGLRLTSDEGALDVDEARFGLFGSVTVDLCGGRADGRWSFGGPWPVELRGVDPAECLTIDGLTLAGALSGSLNLRRSPAGASGDATLAAEAGRIGGRLPNGGIDIGDWTFDHADVDAVFDGPELDLATASLGSSGFLIEVRDARVNLAARPTPTLVGQLRTRIDDPTPRARVLSGLLPQTEPTADGWRRYRVRGPIAGLVVEPL